MRRTALVPAALLAALVPTTAAAAPASLPAVKRTLSVQAAGSADCSTRHASRSTALSVYRAPMSGYVTTKLAASKRSDWDLALFDKRTGRRLATSHSFGSREVAQTWVESGQRIVIQGCLRDGRARRARVATTLFDVKPPEVDAKAKLVSVLVRDQEDVHRLEELGFDLTHNQRLGKAQVVVYDDKQARLLKSLGLKTETNDDDLTASFARARAADLRYTAKDASPLPSGRTSYRVLEDYQNELKKIVADHPALAKPVTIGKTIEGRAIDGVELSSDVGRTDDGKPTYVVVGMHHAREWPSAEAAMEFAWLLAKGHGGDARITGLLDRVRVVIIPIQNVDGFVVSRRDSAFSPNDVGMDNGLWEPGGEPSETLHLAEVVAPGGPPAAYRRKNCRGHFPVGAPCEIQHGVDTNRNYGNGWGGPGASTDPFSQTYRGTGPWSEPEVEAFWHFTRDRNVTNVISIHNVAALVLRPPGLSSAGFAPDEPRMKEIGDAMADATGYTSQFSWQLYDTSGTTEDWNYAAQGSYGYTIEIGPVDGQFHMPFETGFVNEWTGGGKRGGLREALLIGAEAAANPADHARITGSAPAGRVLRLKKSFQTSTGEVCGFANPSILSNICESPGEAQLVDDKIEYTTTVPASGSYSWSVGPSTRPFVAEKWELGDISKINERSWDGLVPADGSDAVIEYTLSEADAAQTFQQVIDLTWEPANLTDLDMYLDWKDPVTGEFRQVALSGNTPGSPEQIELIQPRAGDYRLRIVNYAAGNGQPYKVVLTNNSGNIKVTKSGVTEAYTMTCETPDGKVLETRDVTVGRGQTVDVDFGCGGSAAGTTGGSGDPSAQGVLGVKVKAKQLRHVVVSRRKVRLTRTGFARIRVACSKSADAPCTGVLKLRTAKKYRSKRAATSRRARARRIRLGVKAFSIAPGRTGVVKVRVTPAARRFVARRKRGVPVHVIVTSRDAAGNAAVAMRTIRVLPPKRRSRR